jgi:hypothetical protein
VDIKSGKTENFSCGMKLPDFKLMLRKLSLIRLIKEQKKKENF